MSRYPLLQGELVVNRRTAIVLQAAMVASDHGSIQEVLQDVVNGMAEDTFEEAGVLADDSAPTAFDKCLALFRSENWRRGK